MGRIDSDGESVLHVAGVRGDFRVTTILTWAGIEESAQPKELKESVSRSSSKISVLTFFPRRVLLALLDRNDMGNGSRYPAVEQIATFSMSYKS